MVLMVTHVFIIAKISIIIIVIVPVVFPLLQ